ncbi:helix-turn-helix domain-containing protein [Janibacter hoylei]|uniref:helix-turn-helix domain-containing protein n=1 Tax=Janibacter TaxID=53457 RepID=UPI002238BC91|nr:helix-turn-helix transcriptional regulator [Janibacter hoylei]MCW4602870.1 helix-turn-helix transcriptional regulator [Janibacter hoylei]
MPPEDHRIVCHLDDLLATRGMTITELSKRIGITHANLSALKNNRGRAIRFSTLTALCDALECTPGELFSVGR